jgi:dihydrofolate reductase
MKILSLILACTFEGGIGLNNTIPWYIKSDLIKFKNITTKTNDNLKENAVIMGSKTYDSLPHKKLKNRVNIVLTNNNKKYLNNDDIITFNKIDDALKYCNNNKLIENIYIIGGAKIYNIFLEKYKIDYIYLSLLKEKHFCTSNILINKIFDNFYFIKDDKYNEEKDKYVSYICKNKFYNNIKHNSVSI